MNVYDKVIENTIDNTKGNIIYNSLKNIGKEYNYTIHEDFKRWLNNRICSWYVDGDFLLLGFIYHRGAFREDINKKCLLCEKDNNGIKINKLKSYILLIKGNENDEYINDYLVIKKYKYLGI